MYKITTMEEYGMVDIFLFHLLNIIDSTNSESFNELLQHLIELLNEFEDNNNLTN